MAPDEQMTEMSARLAAVVEGLVAPTLLDLTEPEVQQAAIQQLELAVVEPLEPVQLSVELLS